MIPLHQASWWAFEIFLPNINGIFAINKVRNHISHARQNPLKRVLEDCRKAQEDASIRKEHEPLVALHEHLTFEWFWSLTNEQRITGERRRDRGIG